MAQGIDLVILGGIGLIAVGFVGMMVLAPRWDFFPASSTPLPPPVPLPPETGTLAPGVSVAPGDYQGPHGPHVPESTIPGQYGLPGATVIPPGVG